MFKADLIDPDAQDADLEKDRERVRYNYGIVVRTDIEDEATKKEIYELCHLACEKFAAPEKLPSERDNESAAQMIKDALDQKLRGPFNVIVGEAFGIDMDYIKKTFFYMYFGGYLAILIWKCV